MKNVATIYRKKKIIAVDKKWQLKKIESQGTPELKSKFKSVFMQT